MRGQIAAIIGLVFFVILGGLTGYLAWNGYRTVAGAEGGPKGLRVDLAEAQRDRVKWAGDVAVQEKLLLEQKVDEAKAHLERLQARYEYEGLVLDGENVARVKKVAEDWRGEVKKTPNVTGELAGGVEKETGDRRTAAQEANTKQIKEIIDRIKDMADEGKRSREKAAAELTKLSREKGRLEKERDERRIKIEQLVSREPVMGGSLPPVGQVLASSPETRTAVISIGSRLGVKRGMRFEVYQVRYGNRRVHKGYVEVKSVEAEVSTCGIIVKEVVLPRCPVCGYTAGEPEEQYCPRCTAPGSPQAYQKLLGSPKVVETGASLTDPVVKGDLLFNPLFKLGGGRRYVVVGDGLVEGKDYEKGSVERLVRYYGGEVEKEMGSTTEAVISLRGGKEAVSRAQELGIPIVREFELFRYLEK